MQRYNCRDDDETLRSMLSSDSCNYSVGVTSMKYIFNYICDYTCTAYVNKTCFFVAPTHRDRQIQTCNINKLLILKILSCTA